MLSPAAEQALFRNRSDFDLIVMYDDESTDLVGNSPIATLSHSIFENESHRPLKRPPMLLIGGLRAWKEAIGDNSVIGLSSRRGRIISSKTGHRAPGFTQVVRTTPKRRETRTGDSPRHVPRRRYGGFHPDLPPLDLPCLPEAAGSSTGLLPTAGSSVLSNPGIPSMFGISLSDEEGFPCDRPVDARHPPVKKLPLQRADSSFRTEAFVSEELSVRGGLARICVVCGDENATSTFKPPTDRCIHEPETCAACLRQMLKVAILNERKSSGFQCPSIECRQALQYEDVQKWADVATFERYETR